MLSPFSFSSPSSIAVDAQSSTNLSRTQTTLIARYVASLFVERQSLIIGQRICPSSKTTNDVAADMSDVSRAIFIGFHSSRLSPEANHSLHEFLGFGR